MKTHLHTLLVLLFGATLATAAPRTWTSADGRTIEAEYLGRAGDGESLVLKRTDTQARITVPLDKLSTEDKAYAEALPKTAAPAAPHPPPAPKTGLGEAGKKLCEAVPRMTAPRGRPGLAGAINHHDNQQTLSRYTRLVAAIPSGSPAENLRALRLTIERDIRDTRPTAESKHINEANMAAAVRLYWLETTLTAHLAKIEADLQ